MSDDGDSFPGDDLSKVRAGANRPVWVLGLLILIIGGAVWLSGPIDAPPMTEQQAQQFVSNPLVIVGGIIFFAAALSIIIYGINAVAVTHDTKQWEDEYKRKDEMRARGETYSDEQAAKDAHRTYDDYNASAENQLKWTLLIVGGVIAFGLWLAFSA